MKKLLIGLSIMCIFIMGTPLNATNDGCQTTTMTCPDGTQHYVYWCDAGDYWGWSEILCDVAVN